MISDSLKETAYNMPITVAGQSDIGRKRDTNEDSFLVLQPTFVSLLPVEHVLLVADGMGGHQRGEVASGNVRDVFESVFSEHYTEFLENYKINSIHHLVETLILEIHSNLRNMSQEFVNAEDQREMMGTTLTVALITGNNLVLGHIGDSRAYLVRGDMIAQLTEDHTIAHRLVKAGKLSPEEAKQSKYRNALSQALGISETIQPDIASFPIEEDDILLLCTDGLTRYLQDHEIIDILTTSSPLDACQKLIDIANARGGRDNITVIGAKI